MNGSTRIIQRLAKSLITDRNHPGFSFPYRGVHSPTWHQTEILLKHDKAWREERTWKYNSESPGEAFASLMDRIRKDPVYRLNLIMQGGWTEETYHILVELIKVAKDNKRWNQLYGGISYHKRLQYYLQRDKYYRSGGRDRQSIPNYEGADEEQTRMVQRLGKGKHVAAASKAPTTEPTPEVKFREIWQIDRAERLGYASTADFLQDAQRSAPDGAAGSSTDALATRATLLPRYEKYHCLQCCKPSALANLWECERCTEQAGKSIYFHRPSPYHNCYRAHEHYCNSAMMFGWRQ